MAKGIDTSHWQGDKGKIDWGKVRSSGIEFAILKASQGIAFPDKWFQRDREGARKAGILVGCYHFADGIDAVKEADYFLSVVGEMNQYEFLALDWEVEHANPSAWCKKFLDHVFKKTKIRPLLYTNEARVKKIDWSRIAKDYGLWVAKYPWFDVGIKGMKPTSGQWDFYAIWQYSSKGKVNGIVGNVDMDEFNGSIDALKKYGEKESSCTHLCPVHCV